MVQKDYRLTGWLDLMVGGLLYIDFTTLDFESAYMQLIQQIEAKGKLWSNSKDRPWNYMISRDGQIFANIRMKEQPNILIQRLKDNKLWMKRKLF